MAPRKSSVRRTSPALQQPVIARARRSTCREVDYLVLHTGRVSKKPAAPRGKAGARSVTPAAVEAAEVPVVEGQVEAQVVEATVVAPVGEAVGAPVGEVVGTPVREVLGAPVVENLGTPVVAPVVEAQVEALAVEAPVAAMEELAAFTGNADAAPSTSPAVEAAVEVSRGADTLLAAAVGAFIDAAAATAAEGSGEGTVEGAEAARERSVSLVPVPEGLEAAGAVSGAGGSTPAEERTVVLKPGAPEKRKRVAFAEEADVWVYAAVSREGESSMLVFPSANWVI